MQGLRHECTGVHERLEIVFGGWKSHLRTCQSCKNLDEAIADLCRQLLNGRRLCRRHKLWHQFLLCRTKEGRSASHS